MFWKSKEKKRTEMLERWGFHRDDGMGFGLIDKYYALQPTTNGPYRLNEQTRADLDFDGFFRFCYWRSRASREKW